MELVEDVDEFPQLCSLCLGAQLEGLNSTPHDLSGGNAECTRFGIERCPLLRRHQDHQSSGHCHLYPIYLHLHQYVIADITA
jgi:hypothetical protein